MTFGLPKLTKLNMNSVNSKNNSSDQKSNNLAQTNQTALLATPTQTVYATPNYTNQINVNNSTSSKLVYASKTSQLKTPSVQISKQQATEQPSANTMETHSTDIKSQTPMSSTTTTTTTTTSKLSKMPTQIASKLSLTKSTIQTLNASNNSNVQSPTSIDQTQLSTFQTAAQGIRLKPNGQTKTDFIQQESNNPNETNSGKNLCLPEKETKKSVCNDLSNTDDELESLNLDDLSNERLIDDNDEEFQKFLNSPEENSNYINNSNPISMSIVDNKR